LEANILSSSEFKSVIVELKDAPVIPYEIKTENSANILSIKGRKDILFYSCNKKLFFEVTFVLSPHPESKTR